MISIPDVDIDLSNRKKVLALFTQMIPASEIASDERMIAHKTGVYFQAIPTDPMDGWATFPYDIAEELGYYKFDFIPNHVYDLVESPDHLDELLERPVGWDWFVDKRFYSATDPRYKLTHLHEYHELCLEYPPRSIMDIAMLIALIRPGKQYLIGESWDKITREIWIKDNRKYVFKKSHALGFAHLVVVHAQLISDWLKTEKKIEAGFFD